jgi:hypothetical protein
MPLSSVTRVDGLVVVSVVASGRNGQCEAVQVMTAAATAAQGSLMIRLAGYRGVKRIIDSGLSMATADLAVAIHQPGALFERPWHDRSPWQRVEV